VQQLTRIAIGLGSNKKDRRHFLERAFLRLCEDLLENPSASSIYETPPWGGVASGSFLNAVVRGVTDWKPPAIINYLKELERELGRSVTQHLGDREIDLDLLAHGASIWNQEGIRVPHPGIESRDFVLVPFVEVWPDWEHPILKRTTAELLKAFKGEPKVVLVGPLNTKIP
jgi:2-amino-4-hydroxy-6-hydroxymethyldihydropteridine diphosphokinase